MLSRRAFRLEACRVTLEVDRRQLTWNESLEGRLILEGGEIPQTLLSCQVSLWVGSRGDTTDRRTWERLTVQPQERVEWPFSLQLPRGTPEFGSVGRVTARLVTPGILPGSFFGWEHDFDLPIEIPPPDDFVRIAGLLAELSGMELSTWKVISGGDAAEMCLSSWRRRDPLAEIRLRLFRTEPLCGELLTEGRPRAGRLTVERRRIPLRFESSEPEEVRRVLRACLDPVLTGTEAMPIPSTRPELALEALPVPSAPESPAPRNLPRPAGDIDRG